LNGLVRKQDNVTLRRERSGRARSEATRRIRGQMRPGLPSLTFGGRKRGGRVFPDFVNLSRFQPLLPRPILG
jgi:hypothetical protein